MLQGHFRSLGQQLIKSRDLFSQCLLEIKSSRLGSQSLKRWKNIWENWEVEPFQNHTSKSWEEVSQDQALGCIFRQSGFWGRQDQCREIRVSQVNAPIIMCKASTSLIVRWSSQLFSNDLIEAITWWIGVAVKSPTPWVYWVRDVLC